MLLWLEILDLEECDFIQYRPPTDLPEEFVVVNVKRDREWFKQKMPVMKEFWDSVLYYRTHGIENHPKYKSYKEKSTTNTKKREFTKSGITLEINKNIPLFINDGD